MINHCDEQMKDEAQAPYGAHKKGCQEIWSTLISFTPQITSTGSFCKSHSHHPGQAKTAALGETRSHEGKNMSVREMTAEELLGGRAQVAFATPGIVQGLKKLKLRKAPRTVDVFDNQLPGF